MKRKRIAISTVMCALIMALTPACSRTTTGGAATPETPRSVQEALQKKAFTIRIRQMYPQNRRSISLNSYYALELRNDSVFSDLPYFGEAYFALDPNDPGLVFDAPVTDWTVTPGKKGQTTVSFQTRHHTDIYTYTVTLWNNGTADVRIQAMRRQPISYHGELEEEE